MEERENVGNGENAPWGAQREVKEGLAARARVTMRGNGPRIAMRPTSAKDLGKGHLVMSPCSWLLYKNLKDFSNFLCSPFYVKGVSLGYVGRIKT